MKSSKKGLVKKGSVINIFTSDIFFDRINQCIDEQTRTSNKSGFSVILDIEKRKILYGDVVSRDIENEFIEPSEHCPIYLPQESIQNTLEDNDLSLYEYVHLLNLNMYPQTKKRKICKSDIYNFLAQREDLFYEGDKEKIDSRPVEVIARISKNHRNLDMILIQETGDFPFGIEKTNEIHKLLKQESYSSIEGLQLTSLSLNLNDGKWNYTNSSDKNGIGEFEYSPRILKG